MSDEFFGCGIIFQAIFFVLIRPLSKSTYRRINRVLAELLWLELVWIVDWWAGVKVMMIVFLHKRSVISIFIKVSSLL